MNKLALTLAALMLTSVAAARDDVGSYSIADALATEDAVAVLDRGVRFYFGEQPHPAVQESHGEFPTNKKTNAFNKSDEEACQWVFLSAMLSLRDRALAEGGNAVINIRSNYKNNLTSDTETFKCGAGTFVAGVALVGTVVTLPE